MVQDAADYKRRGQAMFLAVLTLGATMLAVSTIAGLLMVYQIRQVTDFESSASSIFAADAGAEWALYSYFQQTPVSLPAFSNGASAAVTCYDASSSPTPSCAATSSAYAISNGSSGDTRRAFLTTFQSETSTLP